MLEHENAMRLPDGLVALCVISPYPLIPYAMWTAYLELVLKGPDFLV